MGSCGGLLRYRRCSDHREDCRHVPKAFRVMCGLVFGFAQFGSDPAFANGYHRKAGSCRGCNLPPSKVVNTHKVVTTPGWCITRRSSRTPAW